MRIIFIIWFLLFSASVLAETVDTYVVISNTESHSVDNHTDVIKFYKSQVVSSLESNAKRILVKNEFSHKAWLPRSVLIKASSFKPITNWYGDRKFEITTASYDSGQIYQFKTDGTFTAVFDDNVKPRKWSGKLYKNGNIIWAKKNGSSNLEHWNVFRILKHNKLCTLNFDTELGCECVGSYDSLLTTAC